MKAKPNYVVHEPDEHQAMRYGIELLVGHLENRAELNKYQRERLYSFALNEKAANQRNRWIYPDRSGSGVWFVSWTYLADVLDEACFWWGWPRANPDAPPPVVPQEAGRGTPRGSRVARDACPVCSGTGKLRVVRTPKRKAP